MQQLTIPPIVAHRGASADAPENTLAAFRLAWAQQADAIEADFRATADGHVICIHDETFRRTGRVVRRVRAMTLDEVRQLDVGRWKSEAFVGERVPTLAEVLDTLPPGGELFLEWKAGLAGVESLLRELHTMADARLRVRVISFDADVVAAVKRGVDVRAYWIVGFDEKKRRDWKSAEQILAALDAIGADGCDIEAKPQIVTSAFSALLRANARELHTWTVDDTILARRMIGLGVSSLTTNRPAALRAGLSLTPSTLHGT